MDPEVRVRRADLLGGFVHRRGDGHCLRSAEQGDGSGGLGTSSVSRGRSFGAVFRIGVYELLILQNYKLRIVRM